MSVQYLDTRLRLNNLNFDKTPKLPEKPSVYYDPHLLRPFCSRSLLAVTALAAEFKEMRAEVKRLRRKVKRLRRKVKKLPRKVSQ